MLDSADSAVELLSAVLFDAFRERGVAFAQLLGALGQLLDLRVYGCHLLQGFLLQHRVFQQRVYRVALVEDVGVVGFRDVTGARRANQVLRRLHSQRQNLRVEDVQAKQVREHVHGAGPHAVQAGAERLGGREHLLVQRRELLVGLPNALQRRDRRVDHDVGHRVVPLEVELYGRVDVLGGVVNGGCLGHQVTARVLRRGHAGLDLRDVDQVPPNERQVLYALLVFHHAREHEGVAVQNQGQLLALSRVHVVILLHAVVDAVHVLHGAIGIFQQLRLNNFAVFAFLSSLR
ncbi:H(+)/Cl(-) exchange transporter 4 [Babesia caballi]|uniref:H(+)/Cl(-) exchange transporter 4 n=1 Tax=Babesia caballi TaxID=5871 RepID=A0AAV4LX71_BABCB|nr:H(+)/Cl(-) exchange transporter 4 [Babesia caballi]